mgnify:FL=1
MAFLVIVTRIAKVIMVCPGNIENKIRFLPPNSPPANPSALLNFNLVLNVHKRYFLQQGGVSAFQKLSGILRTYVRGFSVISCVVILQTSDRSRFSLFRLLYGTSYAFFSFFYILKHHC